MKKKISMAFVFLLAAVLLSFTNMWSVLSGFLSVFRGFTPMRLVNYLLNLLNTLMPLILLALLIINNYKDVQKLAGLIMIILGVARLIPQVLQLQSLINLFQFDLLPMVSGLIGKATAILTGVVLILGGLSIQSKEKKKAIVFLSSFGVYISIVPLALAVILGNAPLLPTLLPILLFVGIGQTPVAIYDHDNCVLLNEFNTKIVLIVGAVILGIILVSSALSGNSPSLGSSSSGRTCAQAGCSRPAVTSGDSVYCSSHSNRCGNCGCYIDGDAMFCMDCLRGALGK